MLSNKEICNRIAEISVLKIPYPIKEIMDLAYELNPNWAYIINQFVAGYQNGTITVDNLPNLISYYLLIKVENETT